jgi:hypothetical protein
MPYSNLVVSDEDVTEEEVKTVFVSSGATDWDWKKAKDIITYVMEKKEVGATIKEIRVRCNNLIMQVMLLL